MFSNTLSIIFYCCSLLWYNCNNFFFFVCVANVVAFAEAFVVVSSFVIGATESSKEFPTNHFSFQTAGSLLQANVCLSFSMRYDNLYMLCVQTLDCFFFFLEGGGRKKGEGETCRTACL